MDMQSFTVIIQFCFYIELWLCTSKACRSNESIFLLLQLAVTPQPRVNGEYLSVQAGSQLAVKVEGVIQHGTHPGRFRSVSGVVLTLSSQLTSRLIVDNKVRR